MNASKVGQSLFLRDRDLSCVQAVRCTCLFGNHFVRPTGLSADDRFNNRLTVQTRVDKRVRYFSLGSRGDTRCDTCADFRNL